MTAVPANISSYTSAEDLLYGLTEYILLKQNTPASNPDNNTIISALSRNSSTGIITCTFQLSSVASINNDGNVVVNVTEELT